MKDSESKFLTSFQRKMLTKRLEVANLSEQDTKRARIILMADEGKSQAEICRHLSCCPATARHWTLIAQSGKAHLCFDSPMGRPKVVNSGYISRLKELVESEPRAHGYVFRQWTAAWLSKHLQKEFGIRISDRHINRLLKKMGLSTRRSIVAIDDDSSKELTDTLSKENLSNSQPTEERLQSSQIFIHDLQTASSEGSPSSASTCKILKTLNSLNGGSKIYGAFSYRKSVGLPNAQYSFWHRYVRHPMERIS